MEQMNLGLDIDPIEKKIVPNNSLIIIKNAKTTLSKAQKSFNRLTDRVKHLTATIQIYQTELDNCLAFYAKEIFPLEQKIFDLRTEYIKGLFKIYNDKSNKKTKNFRFIKIIISNQFDLVLENDRCTFDEELESIFKSVNGVNIEKYKEIRNDEMKSQFEDVLHGMGLDIDLEGLNFNDPTSESYHKIREIQENIKRKQQEDEKHHASKKKTKKQLEKEAREKSIQEARKKSIGTIYKQLAKVLHPDLEQDENLKLEKDELMKQLTNAYENNDMHKLLSLEMEWIHNNTNHLDTLTEEKLGIYNEILNEQVQELETEYYSLQEHPKYNCLNNILSLEKITLRAIKMQGKYMGQFLIDFEKRINQLNGKNPMKVVKEIIYEFEIIF